jgi:hypothetical protein
MSRCARWSQSSRLTLPYPSRSVAAVHSQHPVVGSRRSFLAIRSGIKVLLNGLMKCAPNALTPDNQTWCRHALTGTPLHHDEARLTAGLPQLLELLSSSNDA